jgi:uncharacterized membrane protein
MLLQADLKTWPIAALWAALLVLSAPVGVYALRYWSGDPALLPFELRLNMLHNPPAFILHTSFGGLALLLAPWQFVARLRQRRPRLHRWIGRVYVGCILVSGVAAYPVAFGTVAGPIAAAGFATMATAWLTVTAIAFEAARRRRFAAHRRWMVRSFALTLSAVTLRAVLLVPALVPTHWPLDFMSVYRASTWISWVLNLALAELWLRATDPARAQLVRLDPLHGALGSGTLTQNSGRRE